MNWRTLASDISEFLMVASVLLPALVFIHSCGPVEAKPARTTNDVLNHADLVVATETDWWRSERIRAQALMDTGAVQMVWWGVYWQLIEECD